MILDHDVDVDEFEKMGIQLFKSTIIDKAVNQSNDSVCFVSRCLPAKSPFSTMLYGQSPSTNYAATHNNGLHLAGSRNVHHVSCPR